MALPQRKTQTTEENNSPQTYKYQIRNAQKEESIGLNDDFKYLSKDDGNRTDDRLLSSKNPALRNRDQRLKQEPANDPKYEQSKFTRSARSAARVAKKAKKGLLLLRKPKKAFVRIKATTVSWTIVTWGMAAWVMQLVFALLSVVFLGLIAAGQAATNSSLITRIGGWFVERAVEAATWVISGTAIGLSDMGGAAFIGCYMVAFAIGFITLIVANAQYMVTFMHPMSGEQNGMKYMAFLIALIGYATPILNIFPWFLVFVAVVWKYPK